MGHGSRQVAQVLKRVEAIEKKMADKQKKQFAGMFDKMNAGSSPSEEKPAAEEPEPEV